MSEPYGHAFVATPSNTVDLPFISREIYIGGTGNLTVIMQGGASCLFSALPVGAKLPIACERIMATGTTATLITVMC